MITGPVVHVHIDESVVVLKLANLTCKYFCEQTLDAHAFTLSGVGMQCFLIASETNTIRKVFIIAKIQPVLEILKKSKWGCFIPLYLLSKYRRDH